MATFSIQSETMFKDITSERDLDVQGNKADLQAHLLAALDTKESSARKENEEAAEKINEAVVDIKDLKTALVERVLDVNGKRADLEARHLAALSGQKCSAMKPWVGASADLIGQSCNSEPDLVKASVTAAAGLKQKGHKTAQKASQKAAEFLEVYTA